MYGLVEQAILKSSSSIYIFLIIDKTLYASASKWNENILSKWELFKWIFITNSSNALFSTSTGCHICVFSIITINGHKICMNSHFICKLRASSYITISLNLIFWREMYVMEGYNKCIFTNLEIMTLIKWPKILSNEFNILTSRCATNIEI